MMKYKWNYLKTLEYLNQKKVDAVITKEMLEALKDIEKEVLSDMFLQSPQADKKMRRSSTQKAMRSDWQISDIFRATENQSANFISSS